jgi:hypothetical protein
MSTDQHFPFWPFIAVSLLMFCVPLTLLTISHNKRAPAAPCPVTTPAPAMPAPEPKLT